MIPSVRNRRRTVWYLVSRRLLQISAARIGDNAGFASQTVVFISVGRVQKQQLADTKAALQLFGGCMIFAAQRQSLQRVPISLGASCFCEGRRCRSSKEWVSFNIKPTVTTINSSLGAVMQTRNEAQAIAPSTLVVVGVGGALIGTWIHSGWISAIVGAAVAIALVAYSVAGSWK